MVEAGIFALFALALFAFAWWGDLSVIGDEEEDG